MRVHHSLPNVIVLAIAGTATAPAVARDLVRLTYDVEANCPSEAEYLQRVGEHVKAAWLAQPGQFARPMHVHAQAVEGRWFARLMFEDEAGRAIVRTLDAASCDEAVSAIALVTALALEQDDLSAKREMSQQTPATAAAPLVEVSRLAENAQHAPLVMPVVTPPQTQETNTFKPKESDSKRKASQPSWLHGFGAGIGATRGIGLGIATAANLFLDIGGQAELSRVRLGFVGYRSGLDETQVPGFLARSWAVAARGQWCPWQARLTAALALPLCGGMEAGILGVRGQSDPSAAVRTKHSEVPWVVGFLSPRLRLADANFSMDLGPELRFSGVRRSFVVQYGTVQEGAFEIPGFAFGGGLSLSVRFP